MIVQFRSARLGSSQPGYIVMEVGYQPEVIKQNYTIEFILRAFNNTPSNIIVRLEVADVTGTSTTTRLLRQHDFLLGRWTLFHMYCITTGNKWDFNIYWMGIANVDASLIRIKKPLATVAHRH